MTAENKPAPRMRPWIRVLLVVSLVFNLIIIGGVAGMALRFGRDGPPKHVEQGQKSPMVFALSHEERRELGRSIRNAHKDYARDARQEKEYYEDLIAALEAEPFSPDALQTARDALDDRLSMRRVIARDIWLEKVADMSAEERGDYAARMREALERKRHWKPRKP